MDEIRKLNNLLRVAKYGSNYVPTKRPTELALGEYFQVSEAAKRTTKWGERAALTILVNNTEYLLFLGDYESNKDRLQSIQELLATENKGLTVAVESIEERTAPNQPIAHFDFKIVDLPQAVKNI